MWLVATLGGGGGGAPPPPPPQVKLWTWYCLTLPMVLSTWIRNEAILQVLVMSVLDKLMSTCNKRGDGKFIATCKYNSYEISKLYLPWQNRQDWQDLHVIIMPLHLLISLSEMPPVYKLDTNVHAPVVLMSIKCSKSLRCLYYNDQIDGWILSDDGVLILWRSNHAVHIRDRLATI